MSDILKVAGWSKETTLMLLHNTNAMYAVLNVCDMQSLTVYVITFVGSSFICCYLVLC